MANTGKNKLLRWLRVFINGYDLSGDARSIGTLMNAFGEVEMTGLSHSVKYFAADKVRQAGITDFKTLLNDAAAGAYTQLKNNSLSIEISALFGAAPEPDFGDPAYLLYSAQLMHQLGWEGAAASVGANFMPQHDTGNPIGVVLHPNTSLSDTTEGTEHDNGASSSNGWHANLHITASDAGDWEFKIEHSATGLWAGEEATLGTFTADGSAIGSEHLTGTGTVNQYTRFVATRTSGTVTPICTFARN
jgi:hypothetical protein